MVVIEQASDGTPTIWCDPEIADLVTALNASGIRTTASCSGHGEGHGRIALRDGRQLFVFADFDEADKAERLFAAQQSAGKPTL